MDKILLFGYFGFGNLGDDLILEALIQRLRQSHPEAAIAALSARPRRTQQQFGIPCYQRWNPWEVLRAVIQCNLLTTSGGLFQDATSPWSFYYYQGILILGLLFKKRVQLLSVGIEPLRLSLHKKLLAFLCGLCEKVSVRDEFSQRRLVEYGVRRPILVEEDLVFSILPPKKISCNVDRKRKIGIILRGNSEKDNLRKRWVQELLRSENEVWMISFQPKKEWGQLKEWKQEFPSLNVAGWELHNWRSQLSLLDEIWTERLHGLILSHLAEIPVKPLPWKNLKVEEFHHCMKAGSLL